MPLHEGRVRPPTDRSPPFTFSAYSKNGERRGAYRPARRALLLAVTIIAVVFFFGLPGRSLPASTSIPEAGRHTSPLSSSRQSQNVLVRPPQERRTLKHVLVAATEPSVDLCRFLLSSATLYYPPPHLLSWNETLTRPNRRARGAHIVKIDRVLDYLDGLNQDEQEDLVLIADGEDIWFQLPAAVLVSRYYSIIMAADARLAERFGPQGVAAIQQDHLDPEIGSKIVFGAGKECLPNQPHTMACYMAPLSPVSGQLYGQNTDTSVGHDTFYSHKQRYLDSGYIIGPAAAVRKLFKRAQEYAAVTDAKSKAGLHLDASDNGSGSSDDVYHGSDQSIFARIWGRQEYIREVVRRRFDHSAGGPRDVHKRGSIHGTVIEDLLNPAFTHEKWDGHEDLWADEPFHLLKHHDFGITLDYYSTIGHQTWHSERDAAWITHQDPSGKSESAGRRSTRIASQLAGFLGQPSPFDCTHSIPSAPPRDVLSSSLPSTTRYNRTNATIDTALPPPSWLTTPLYTHLCLSTTPALIHHNSPAPLLNPYLTPTAHKKSAWHRLSWLYGVARPLVLGPSIYEANGFSSPEVEFDEVDSIAEGPGFAGAIADKGYSLSFNQLCRPMAMLLKEELFGVNGTFKKVDVQEEIRKAREKAAAKGLSLTGDKGKDLPG